MFIVHLYQLIIQEIDKGENKRAIKRIESRKKAKEKGQQAQNHRNMLRNIEESIRRFKSEQNYDMEISKSRR